ncbi:hypothetical protein A9Q68_09570 [Streptococcus bovimastitidis]|uniref:GmrSD restriction endonucleases N-terminal domain-containing protein n=1 Tax=Streptococcus bovimastitidis TaxID=1856638 RepID=A0A1L8ML02_9STRE|nr:DUF262 domain-containing protein [Streptococcus bovimastitidis]OJF71419.1 hypothetical protein A9Q68_09570 [Streptococcus bovimastitidis]
MDIFYLVHNFKVIAINTEEIDSYKQLRNIKNQEELNTKFEELGLEIEDGIIEEIQEIFGLDNTDDGNRNEEFRIKHWVSNRSFGELVDMYKHGEIKTPEMQRKFVWNSVKSSRLIESIILGLPIPPLFLLEVDDNEYEIIDGYQRLTTLHNFIEGLPWVGYKEGKRKVTSRLSRKNILKDIEGKCFDELSIDHQTKLRRSTIPLVEFKQLSPGDFSSKYLIFERINTGSEKLNGMQIRKSLAYGPFMENLYDAANSNDNYLSLFSTTQIKKDIHVEALLRILAVSDLNFGRFSPKRYGIKNILDEYGELYRNTEISQDRLKAIFSYIEQFVDLFQKNHVFKRVNSEGEFEGIINIGILESLVGSFVESNKVIPDKFIDIYKKELTKLWDSYVLEEQENPFSTNTGSLESIQKRYEIFKSMIG